jgi:2-polyprenyl-3-methyl-5-hydroxy-6-metoxy-1,4-benzoquinol methylase
VSNESRRNIKIDKKELFRLKEEKNYNIEDLTLYFDNWFLDDYEIQVINNSYVANEIFFDFFYFGFLKKQNINEKVILDVGCGTGLTGMNFIENGYEVYGTDITDKAKTIPISRGYKDVYYWDLKKNIFDRKLNKFKIVMSVGVLGDFIEPKKGLENILEKVSIGGYLGVSIEKSLSRNNLKIINTLRKEDKVKLLDYRLDKGYCWKELIEFKYEYFIFQKLK